MARRRTAIPNVDSSILPPLGSEQDLSAPNSADNALPELPDLGFGDKSIGQVAAPELPELPTQRLPAEQAYDQVKDLNPDEAAKVDRYSKQLNADPSHVAENLPEIEKAAKEPVPALFVDLHERFPNTAEFLSDPSNMAKSHDDISNLSFSERAVKAITDTWSAGKQSILTTLLQEERDLQTYQMNSINYSTSTRDNSELQTGGTTLGHVLANKLQLSQDPATRVQEINYILKGMQGKEPTGFKKALYGAVGLGEQGVSALMYSAKYGAPAALATGALGLATGTAPAAIAVAARAAFGAGEAVGGAEYNFKLFTGQEIARLSEMRDSQGKPLDQNLIKTISAFTGAANASLGMIQLGAIVKTIPGAEKIFQGFVTAAGEKVLTDPITRSNALKTFATNLLKATVHGFGTFAGMEGINTAGEEIAKADTLASEAAAGVPTPSEQELALHPERNLAPAKMGDIGKRMLQAGVEGAQTVGILSTFGHSSNLITDFYRAEKTATAKEYYEAAGKGAEDSKLRERDPEAYKAFMEKNTQGTEVQDIHLTTDKAEEYFQSKGIDITKAMTELGAAEAYAEAKATGQPIKIPFANYLDKIVGTDHWKGLEEDVKFHADDHTPREIAEYEKSKREQQKSTDKAVQEQLANVQAEQDASKLKIQNDVYEKLQLAGKTHEESLRGGQLHQAYFNTMGQILGLDPNQLYEKRKLQIKGGEELVPGIDQHLQDNQGSTAFTKSKEAVISLFKGSDKSTFLHESGHLFLDVHREAVDLLKDAEKLTPEQENFMKDSDVLLKWLGAESWDKLDTNAHEKFARGFEEYLREGKAPSEGLKTAFRKFGAWLKAVYKNIKNKAGQVVGIEGLPQNINPEVRDIMDRMLATQEEISAVRDEMGYKPGEAAEEAPKQAQSLLRLEEQARGDAEEQLMKEQLKETTKEREAQLIEKRKELTKNATKQVSENVPVFQAMDYIKERSNEPADKIAEKILSGTASNSDKAVFDSAADIHGFPDGYNLANDLILAEKHNLRELEIQRMVDDGMVKEYQSLMDPEAIHDAALEALHNDKMAELLALESQIYRSLIVKDPAIKQELSQRRKNEAKVDAKLAKERAERMLSGKKAKDATNDRVYVTAERNAAERVTAAKARGDMEAMVEAKDQQLLNHQLASEARRLKKVFEKQDKYLDKVGKASESELGEKMPKAFVNQVNLLLASQGKAERTPQDIETLTSIAKDMVTRGENENSIANTTGLIQGEDGSWRPETLIEFANRVNDVSYAIKIPDSILSLPPGEFKELTMSQIRDLVYSVKTIVGIGSGFDKWISAFDKSDMNEDAKELRVHTQGGVGFSYAEQLKPGSSNKTMLADRVQKIGNLPDAVIGGLVNLSTVCKYLDLRWDIDKKKFVVDPDGPAQRFIYRVLKAAEDNKLVRYEKMVNKVRENVLSKHFTEQEFADLKNERIYIPEIDRTFTKEEVIATALNWGNEDNRDRVLVGFSWTPEMANAVLDKLTKKDWDFVQAVFDHLETYWPENVELELRVNGVEPTRVKASQIKTKYGDYPGGYYPIAYDPNRSIEAFKSEIQKTALWKMTSTSAASTEQGRNQDRLSYVKRPVRLEVGKVLFNHLEDMAHDLSFRESVIDVGKFLKHSDVSTSITNAIGTKGLYSIQKTLDHVSKVQREDLSPADPFVKWMKQKSQAFALGVRIAALPLDLTGNIFNAMYKLGPGGTAHAITEFLSNRHEHIEFVENNSERMRQRGLFRDKTLMDLHNSWEGRNSAIKSFLYILQSKADEAISYPMWLEVYKNHLEEYGHEKAIHIADDSVTSSFGSGSPIDQVGVQRYKGLMGLMGNFYSWQSMMFNQAWLAGKISGLEYNTGNTMNAIKVMGQAAFYLWGAQSLQENVWKEYLRNNQSDDPEAKKRRIWARIWGQPFGYVWGVRDVANYFIEKGIGGQPGTNYRLSSAEQSLELLTQPLFDKEINVKHVIASGSFALGVPNQIDSWVFNYIDWLHGSGEATWRDLVSRRTKK